MMSMFRTCREQAQSYRAVPVGSADAPGFSRSVGGGGASLEAEVRYPLLSGTSGGSPRLAYPACYDCDAPYADVL